MTQPRSNRLLMIALCVNAGLLAMILLALLARSGPPTFLPIAMAQNQVPIAGGAGVFVMPAQFSSNTWGCYLLDVDAQTLTAYQFYPGDKQLRLIASRNFRYDRRLGNFNTTPPPLEIKDLVDRETQAGRVLERNTASPAPEAPRESP